MTNPMISPLTEVISTLTELLGDSTLPRSVRQTIEQTLTTLQQSPDKVSVNRALSLLEDVADNINMQPDHRSQLFNVVSMLETV